MTSSGFWWLGRQSGAQKNCRSVSGVNWPLQVGQVRTRETG
ncbi:hypothetical protein AB0O31_33135 [Kitasatospora cineracea]